MRCPSFADCRDFVHTIRHFPWGGLVFPLRVWENGRNAAVALLLSFLPPTGSFVRSSRSYLLAALVTTALCLTANPAKAQSTFTPTTSPYSWNDPTNWDMGVPTGPGTSAIFGSSAITGGLSVTLDTGITIGSITITNNGSTSDVFGFVRRRLRKPTETSSAV